MTPLASLFAFSSLFRETIKLEHELATTGKEAGETGAVAARPFDRPGTR